MFQLFFRLIVLAVVAASGLGVYLWVEQPKLEESPWYWQQRRRVLRKLPMAWRGRFLELENLYRFRPPERQMRCQPLAPSPVPRFEGPGVVVRNRLYVFGGFHFNLQAMTRVDFYDPEANAWFPAAELPTPLTHVGIAVEGETVWLAGGFVGHHPGEAVSGVWKYDAASDAWSAGPPLPEPRAGGALLLLGRRLHWFGGLGSDRQTDRGEHWVLDLDAPGGWRPRAAMPQPRNQFGAVAFAGKLYAVGGSVGHDRSSTDVAAVHRYDPAADTWSELSPLPQARSHNEPGTFVSAGGRIVTVGGRANTYAALYNVTAYDPGADSWKELPALPHPLRGPIAVPLGGRLIVATGGLLPWGTGPAAEVLSCDSEDLSL